MPTHLPVVDNQGTLQKDGSRDFVHPADVRGRFTRLRYLVFAVLIAVYLALPFIRIQGRPAVFLDVPNSRFFLFGAAFNAQDFWLAFFLLTGLGFALFLVTTLAGRVWCGYACPQTVFLEGMYRRIERLLEGPAQMRIRRNRGSWTFDKAWRKGAKHALFVGVSLFLSHFFLSYFVSLPSMWEMMRQSPASHPAAFGWTMGMSGLLYFNFAWFREQTCLIVCPYGRLQSMLTDDDTLVIGYDERRGEPRGKVSDPEAGDCIDCKRCVAVCPTGIDIRNGLQIECIGCAACIDACDEIMDKVGRPRGLIRYDSLNGLARKNPHSSVHARQCTTSAGPSPCASPHSTSSTAPAGSGPRTRHLPHPDDPDLDSGDFSGLAGARRRIFRPRIAFYGVLGLVGLAVATFAFRTHEPYEANLLRLPGPPFVVEDGRVRNSFSIHLVNKSDRGTRFELRPVPAKGLDFTIPVRELELGALEDRNVPVFVDAQKGEVPEGTRAVIEVRSEDADAAREVSAAFVGPGP